MSRLNFPMTKIIATLGPATESVKMIEKLINEGARVFRINFSHGSFEDFDERVDNIRKAAKNTCTYVGILGDLSGPKIRVGKVIDEGVMLKKGQQITFTKKEVLGGSSGNEFTFSTTYPKLIQEVKQGEKLLLDDGNLELKATSVEGKGINTKLHCKVVIGGLLTSSKGINLPNTDLSLPSMTEKDFKCAEYAVKKKFDFLALSFVREAKDVKTLKTKLSKMGVRPKGLDITAGDLGFSTSYESDYIPIISKIEKPQAIDNLEEIIVESDGVMVARGDLGVEMDLAEVALLQKKIIRLCNAHMKPVIVATQMLQSMIKEAVPTRAEVSDVANAIMDGADAIMLSGETAVGKYPVETVRMMTRVAMSTNTFIKSDIETRGKFIPYKGLLSKKEAVARAVHMLARDLQPKYIITWTHSGGSTVFLSQQRMHIPIIACGENETRLRQMSMLYSIMPVYEEQPESGSKFISAVNDLLIKNKWAKKGDTVIIVASSPITRRGVTNRLVIHYVGEHASE